MESEGKQNGFAMLCGNVIGMHPLAMSAHFEVFRQDKAKPKHSSLKRMEKYLQC